MSRDWGCSRGSWGVIVYGNRDYCFYKENPSSHSYKHIISIIESNCKSTKVYIFSLSAKLAMKMSVYFGTFCLILDPCIFNFIRLY